MIKLVYNEIDLLDDNINITVYKLMNNINLVSTPDLIFNRRRKKNIVIDLNYYSIYNTDYILNDNILMKNISANINMTTRDMLKIDKDILFKYVQEQYCNILIKNGCIFIKNYFKFINCCKITFYNCYINWNYYRGTTAANEYNVPYEILCYNTNFLNCILTVSYNGILDYGFQGIRFLYDINAVHNCHIPVFSNNIVTNGINYINNFQILDDENTIRKYTNRHYTTLLSKFNNNIFIENSTIIDMSYYKTNINTDTNYRYINLYRNNYSKMTKIAQYNPELTPNYYTLYENFKKFYPNNINFFENYLSYNVNLIYCNYVHNDLGNRKFSTDPLSYNIPYNRIFSILNYDTLSCDISSNIQVEDKLTGYKNLGIGNYFYGYQPKCNLDYHTNNGTLCKPNSDSSSWFYQNNNYQYYWFAEVAEYYLDLLKTRESAYIFTFSVTNNTDIVQYYNFFTNTIDSINKYELFNRPELIQGAVPLSYYYAYPELYKQIIKKSNNMQIYVTTPYYGIDNFENILEQNTVNNLNKHIKFINIR